MRECLVLRPTLDDIRKPFEAFIEKHESKIAQAGIAKIVAPAGWTPRRQGYPDDLDFTIERPIRQHATGSRGLYRGLYVEEKAMSLNRDFRPQALSPENEAPPAADPAELERKYWRNVTLRPPLYGADVLGSLFDEDGEGWNLQRLNTVLSRVLHAAGHSLPGVSEPYLYFGSWRSTFAWHTEDMDLYSVNYLHYGAPKQWYCIPPDSRQRFEQLIKGMLPDLFRACPEFFRHKELIISPLLLDSFAIPYIKTVQHPREFIVNYPGSYHAGYNLGYNCAESVNFGTRHWVPLGAVAEVCQCNPDSVSIDMRLFRDLVPARLLPASIFEDSSSSEDEGEGDTEDREEDNDSDNSGGSDGDDEEDEDADDDASSEDGEDTGSDGEWEVGTRAKRRRVASGRTRRSLGCNTAQGRARKSGGTDSVKRNTAAVGASSRSRRTNAASGATGGQRRMVGATAVGGSVAVAARQSNAGTGVKRTRAAGPVTTGPREKQGPDPGGKRRRTAGSHGGDGCDGGAWCSHGQAGAAGPSTSSAPAPRRRGRPPKNKGIGSVPAGAGDAMADCRIAPFAAAGMDGKGAAAEVSPMTPPRRRGRPPNNAKMAAGGPVSAVGSGGDANAADGKGNTGNVGAAAATTVAPRRRGRPPKKAITTAAAVDVASMGNGSGGDGAGSPLPTPRRRGRPPKNATVAATAVAVAVNHVADKGGADSPNVEGTPSLPTPRRRGRPLKKVATPAAPAPAAPATDNPVEPTQEDADAGSSYCTAASTERKMRDVLQLQLELPTVPSPWRTAWSHVVENVDAAGGEGISGDPRGVPGVPAPAVVAAASAVSVVPPRRQGRPLKRPAVVNGGLDCKELPAVASVSGEGNRKEEMGGGGGGGNAALQVAPPPAKRPVGRPRKHPLPHTPLGCVKNATDADVVSATAATAVQETAVAAAGMLGGGGGGCDGCMAPAEAPPPPPAAAGGAGDLRSLRMLMSSLPRMSQNTRTQQKRHQQRSASGSAGGNSLPAFELLPPLQTLPTLPGQPDGTFGEKTVVLLDETCHPGDPDLNVPPSLPPSSSPPPSASFLRPSRFTRRVLAGCITSESNLSRLAPCPLAGSTIALPTNGSDVGQVAAAMVGAMAVARKTEDASEAAKADGDIALGPECLSVAALLGSLPVNPTASGAVVDGGLASGVAGSTSLVTTTMTTADNNEMKVPITAPPSAGSVVPLETSAAAADEAVAPAAGAGSGSGTDDAQQGAAARSRRATRPTDRFMEMLCSLRPAYRLSFKRS